MESITCVLSTRETARLQPLPLLSRLLSMVYWIGEEVLVAFFQILTVLLPDHEHAWSYLSFLFADHPGVDGVIWGRSVLGCASPLGD